MTEFGSVYGGGLYDLCTEEKIESDVLDQLRSLKALFHENPDFLRLLANMSLTKRERIGILDGALQGQTHPFVLNFLRILVERGAVMAYDECEAAYAECYNRDHQATVADVTVARPLTDQQRAELLAKLKDMTGKDVTIREKVDPSVLGGVLMQMEGKRYDNTVRHRLDAIKQALTQDAFVQEPID